MRTSFFLVLNGLRMQYVQDIQAVFDPGNIFFFMGDDQSAGWCWGFRKGDSSAFLLLPLTDR